MAATATNPSAEHEQSQTLVDVTPGPATCQEYWYRSTHR